MHCGTSDDCTVGRGDSKSFTISWSASASGGEFVSGGFEVSESWTTGNTYECGGKTNENDKPVEQTPAK